jgi:ribosome-associated translation inhibitor RaiA
MPVPQLVVRGDFGIGIEELVTSKLAVVLRHAHEPILGLRVRLSRAAHATGGRPVSIDVTLDVNGGPIQASASARGARDALDRVVAKLVRQLDDQHYPRRGDVGTGRARPRT